MIRSSFNNRKDTAGFTFIELLITIFVISIGLLGAFSVLQQTISSTSQNPPKLTGAYLAQEGIEIVRNIRDTNWLEGEDYYTGLSLDTCKAINDGCAGDYQSTSTLEDYTGEHLYIDADGFYHQETVGEKTPFKRKIVIEEDTDNQNKNYLEVKVYIYWEQKGQTHSVEAQDHLYDWY